MGPGTYTSEPVSETLNWADPVWPPSDRLTPSTIGTRPLLIDNPAGSNGAANNSPPCAYTRCPVGRYLASLPPSTITRRSPVFSDCATTCARSHFSSAVRIARVKSKVSPSGSNSGPCASSPVLTLTMSSGFPPLGDTLRIPLPPWPTRMPFAAQRTPYGRSAAQMVTGAPPVAAIVLIVSSAADQKARDRPSGEKAGFNTPPLPSAPEWGGPAALKSHGGTAAGWPRRRSACHPARWRSPGGRRW